jgi:hypothetical protein
MDSQDVTTQNLSLIGITVFWIMVGIIGGSILNVLYPIYTQNLFLNFVISFFLISLIRRRLFLPGKFSRSADIVGKTAVYISLVVLIVILCWIIYANYWGYFNGINIKLYPISLGLTLVYTYILIEIFYKIGNYLKQHTKK